MKPPTKAKQSTLKPLTVRQQRFCELIVEGKGGTAAYMGAGWKGSREAAKVSASRLLTSDNVKARIAELRKPQTAESLLTKDRKREILRDMVENPATKPADMLRAIEIDAKLAGHFAPDKVEVDAGPKALDSIRERAAKVASALDLNARLRGRGTAARAMGLSRWNPAGPP
jgi:phage terminase small subunit